MKKGRKKQKKIKKFKKKIQKFFQVFLQNFCKFWSFWHQIGAKKLLKLTLLKKKLIFTASIKHNWAFVSLFSLTFFASK